MFRLIVIVICLLFAAQSNANILVFNHDGTYALKDDLAMAAKSADTIGKTIIVTSPQVISTPILWPSDRELRFEKGGYVYFTGSGSLSGLKESRPEWFGAGTTSDDTIAVQRASQASQYLVLSRLYTITDLNLTGRTGGGNGITIKGTHRWTTGFLVKGDAGKYPIIDLSNSGHCVLEDFTINAQSNSAYIGILLARKASESSGNHLLRNITINGAFTLAGIYSISSEGNKYENILIENWTTGAGIKIVDEKTDDGIQSKYNKLGDATGGNTYHTFEHCQIYHTKPNAANVAMHIKHARTVNIYSGYINETSTNAIILDGVTDIIVDGFIQEGFANNTFLLRGAIARMRMSQSQSNTTPKTGVFIKGDNGSTADFLELTGNTGSPYVFSGPVLTHSRIDAGLNSISVTSTAHSNYFYNIYDIRTGFTLPSGSRNTICGSMGGAATDYWCKSP